MTIFQTACLLQHHQLCLESPEARIAFLPGGRTTKRCATSAPGIDGQQAAMTLKRAGDIAAATILLICLSPLMLAIALLIRATSPGPALFRQRRTGFGNRPFWMLKFRSMHTHLEDQASRQQTSRDDPRVTAIGRFLRSSSLDELPQLLNVLAGDMSLVGPRPHALGTRAVGLPLDEVAPRYAERHSVRPGITGLAQVSGCRGELDTREKLQRRVEFDLAYIETWSLRLDLVILGRTLRTLLGNEAY